MTTRRGLLGGVLPLLTLTSAPAPARAGAGSAGAGLPGVSRERYERYIALRNAGDPAFALFYHDGVVMDSVPARTSVEHIVRLAGERRAYFTEHLTIEHYVADENSSAAQLLQEFRCHRDMPAMALTGLLGNAAKAGQVLKQRSMLFYGVEDGRFKSVRAAPPLIVQDWI